MTGSCFLLLALAAQQLPRGLRRMRKQIDYTSSGLRPDAGDFLLFGQEKSHQREGRPGVARCARTPVLPA